MTETIYVVGTEPFFDNFSSDGSSYLSDVASFCSNSWDTNIARGNSNYDASFTAWGASESDLPVPRSVLGACELGWGGVECIELPERRRDARDYLKSNWNRYDTADTILVIDYYGGDDTEGSSDWLYGYSGGGVGTWGKVCIADIYYQEQGYKEWTRGQYSEVGLAGTAWHEVLHMYGAEHKESAIYGVGDTSIMYSYQDQVANCRNNGSDIKRKDIVTTCTTDLVRDYIN